MSKKGNYRWRRIRIWARPMEKDWIVSIKKQCIAQNVAFFFNQWGGVQKHRTGRLLQGRTWNEYPLINAHSQGGTSLSSERT